MTDQDTVTKAKRIAGNAARLEALRKKAQQAQNRLQALEARTAKQQRALDTRRNIIVGTIVLDALASGAAMPQSLDECLARVTRDNDRKAFEGWSLTNHAPEGRQALRAKASEPDLGPDAAVSPALTSSGDVARCSDGSRQPARRSLSWLFGTLEAAKEAARAGLQKFADEPTRQRADHERG